MKAIRVHEQGAPDVLIVEEIDPPQPGPGEVRLIVEAAGVNYIDTYIRSGQYRHALPYTPGSEGAGVVDAVGEGVTETAVGDRVASSQLVGAYAEYALAPVARLVRVPDAVTTLDAAAVMLQGMTAHYLTHDTYPLKKGDTALVHAAAGGVGLLLIQMAKLRGARVIGTVSTDEKAELAMEYGADEVIIYTESDFEAETKRLTGNRGVDVVYDSVGRTTFAKSLNCLRPLGTIALFGQSSGAVDPVDPQILNQKGSIFLTRPNLNHYILTPEALRRRTDDIFGWLSDGSLKLRIDRVFPLESAADAHRYIEGRRTRGKILLSPRGGRAAY